MTRWSEEHLAEYLNRATTAGAIHRVDTLPPSTLPAFGLLQAPSGMNKLETRYAAYLESQRSRTVAWFKFEAIKLRLADNTFYTPDFLVQRTSGAIECHETKGFWRDDARVKIKVAAALYPFRFLGVTSDKNSGWKIEEF